MTDDLTHQDRELVRSIEMAYRPYRFRDSRPVPPRSLRPWIAAAAIVAILVITAGTVLRPPSALASWTSAPTSSDRSALAADTVTACRAQAATLLGVGERAGWPADPALAAMARAPLVAHDQRGTASAALFASEERDEMWTCAIIPVAGQPPYVELGGGTGVVPEDLGPLEIWTATGGWSSDYGGRWEIAGRVDPAVRQATIVRKDGRAVIATIDSGWFLAWWPSESEAVRIDLHAVGGELLASIDLGDRYAQEPGCRIGFLGSICLWWR